MFCFFPLSVLQPWASVNGRFLMSEKPDKEGLHLIISGWSDIPAAKIPETTPTPK
jgi:hypothetical protein